MTSWGGIVSRESRDPVERLLATVWYEQEEFEEKVVIVDRV